LKIISNYENRINEIQSKINLLRIDELKQKYCTEATETQSIIKPLPSSNLEGFDVKKVLDSIIESHFSDDENTL